MKNADKNWQWVFGLFIGEEIEYAAFPVDLNLWHDAGERAYAINPAHLYRKVGRLKDVKKAADLQPLLRKDLEYIAKQQDVPEIFTNVCAIGVGSIGVSDKRELRVTGIARKNWITTGEGYLIDLKQLFKGILPEDAPMRLENDATAMALAESCWQKDDPVKHLFYVHVSEGVNGGFVQYSGPVKTQLHPELGHIFPPLHPSDTNFDSRFSGCPVHTRCYEGLASAARIRKQWNGALLRDLKNHPDKPWETIAFYVAHLCWTGAVTIPPQRILIGGDVVFSELIPVVRKHFRQLNGGSRGKSYLRYPGILDKNFIQSAGLGATSGLLGAIEIGRLAALDRKWEFDKPRRASHLTSVHNN